MESLVLNESSRYLLKLGANEMSKFCIGCLL